RGFRSVGTMDDGIKGLFLRDLDFELRFTARCRASVHKSPDNLTWKEESERASQWRRGLWCPSFENRERWGSLTRGGAKVGQDSSSGVVWDTLSLRIGVSGKGEWPFICGTWDLVPRGMVGIIEVWWK